MWIFLLWIGEKNCTNVKGHVYGGPVSSNALKLQQIEKGCKNNRKTEKNNAVKVHKEERECFGETKQKTAKSKQMFTILYELCD